MKKAIKRVIWLVILIIIVAIGGYYAYSAKNKPTEFTTVKAERSDITQIVEATGSVASAEDISLTFKTAGKIQEISVEIGDEVKRGQSLARILDISLSSQVDKARAAVASAQANLDQLLAGATTEEIAVSRQKVSKAQADLAAARVELANSETNRDETRQVYLDTALQSIHDALFVINYSLESVYDGILDDDADDNFLTTNSQLLMDAENQYDDIVSVSYDQAQKAIVTAEANQSKEDILNSLYKTMDALSETLSLVYKSFDLVSNAIPKETYTQTVLDAWKTSFNTRATSLASEKTSIQTSITDLTVDWQNLDSAYDTKFSNVTIAQHALSLVQAQHDELIAAPEDYEIKQQQAKVLQAQADLQAAQSNFADTIIIAPVDGLITNVDMEEGELAGPSDAVIEMIGDNTLQIDVDIPEADISKIQIGQAVDITLDAFGLDDHFSGKVTFIEPSERLIQDVVYYRVTVIFDEEQEKIKPGMTADITIVTAQRNHVVSVPLRAVIIDKNGKKTVKVLENNQPVIREVTTGIRGDEGLVEITSGLEEGESVITGEVSQK